jgi:hypothetical protein
LSAASTAPAAIRFDSFHAIEGLRLVGDSTVSDGKILRLTPARNDRSGAAWLVDKQPVGSGFETTFQFRLTHQGGLGQGADGFAFVLQNSGPAALGGRGSSGGFAVRDPNYPKEAGIPWSIAVFFDTHRNTEEGDPSSNYVAFRTNGRPGEMRWPAERLAFTPKLRVQLKDGKVHTARIRFEPPLLSVFLDDGAAPVLASVVDLSIVLDQDAKAWAGFTASTGGGYENHDILNWAFAGTDVSSNMSMVSSQLTFLMSACLPGRNLCTPERAVVERSGAGYHVILPANLEWGVSVPTGRDGTVTVSNAHGIACWNRARGGGCSGPNGNGVPAGPGFLAAEQAGGALIRKSHGGQTWFSVNGPSGSSLSDSEGFYEFDLEIK